MNERAAEERPRRTDRRALAAEAGLAAGLSLLLAIVGISAWRLALDVPFEISWDSLTGQTLVKGVLDNGWHWTNDYIGAPYGTQLYDFPQGDSNLHFLVIKVLGVFSGDHVVVFNVFWLLGFPLCGLTAWLVLRDLGLPGIPAVTCAVLFAILPYHFWRGEAHVLLAAYYVVPLACWLVLRVLGRRRIVALDAPADGPWWKRISRGRALLAVGVCVAIGSAGIYYAVFTVLLLGLAAFLVAWDREGRASALEALAAIAVIGLALVLNLSPSLAFHAEHGDNPRVAQRGPGESEQYGLSLIGMLLPTDNHRLDSFADAKADFYARTPTPGEGSASLGIVASAGLLFLLFVLVRSAMGRAPPRVSPVVRVAATAAALAFLIGTVGGLSSVFARTVGSEIRSWNRISVFIAFFCLVAVGWVLAELMQRRRGRPKARLLALGVAAALLAFATWDQAVPVREGQFDPDFVEAQWESDEAFVEELEDRLPQGAAVMQLPYLKFPEGYPPPGAMNDHDPFRGYLHSEDLRWSYGAMKGRSADVLACLKNAPAPVLAAAADAFGFSGIWVDRVGYDDAGRRIERELASATGAEPVESPDGRFVAFILEGGPGDAATAQRLEAAKPATGDEVQDCEPLKSAGASVTAAVSSSP